MNQQRYQIIEKIGHGGLGEVYLARDTQLDREVALKRMKLPDDGKSEAMEADLMREAKTLSALQHPNIVTVYDVGKDERGPFVVLELLKGESLDAVIDRGGMTLDDFRQVVVQSLEGLLAAQAVGLVHRDLKPGNIMVVWLASGKFQIKILDFGLAKFSLKARPQTEDVGGGIFGSIFFMAPEQFERFPLDARTDMYSLGCIYYQILSTKHPFTGETGVEVMASHLQHHVIPLKQVRPDLPDWLCHWVMWLISREMEDRPADAKMALEYFMAQRHGVRGIAPPAPPASKTGIPQHLRGNVPGTRPGVRGPITASQPISTSAQATMSATMSSTSRMKRLPKRKSNVLLWIIICLAALVLGGGLAYLFLSGPANPTPTANPVPSRVNPTPNQAKPAEEKAVDPEATAASSQLDKFLNGNDTTLRSIVVNLPADQGQRLTEFRALLKVAATPEQRAKFVKTLGQESLLDSTELFTNGLTSSDAAERLAFLQFYNAWGPKPDIAETLRTSADLGTPEPALTAYCQLITQMGTSAEDRLALLTKIKSETKHPNVRTAFLSALATISHPNARALADELKEPATVQTIDANITKVLVLDANALQLPAVSAHQMGHPKGAAIDTATGTISGWTNEQTYFGWDLQITEPRKVLVRFSLSNTGTESCLYRIALGDFTAPMVVPQTALDSQFVNTPISEMTITKPGIYRLTIIPLKIPDKQNFMILREAVISKK